MSPTTHTVTYTLYMTKTQSDTHKYKKQDNTKETTGTTIIGRGDQFKSVTAPSSRPKLLHLVREPHTHNTEACTIAKANRARIHPNYLINMTQHSNHCITHGGVIIT